MARRQVARAQRVLDANVSNGLVPIQITASYVGIEWPTFRAALAGGALPALMLHDGSASQWKSDPELDAFPLFAPLRRLLTMSRESNVLSVWIVPGFVNYDRWWKPARAVSISPNDYPQTTGAPASGPAIVMTGDETNDTVLVHELAHILVDLPRATRGGNEHVDDRTRVCAETNGPVGDRLTAEECQFINRNVLRYEGNRPLTFRSPTSRRSGG